MSPMRAAFFTVSSKQDYLNNPDGGDSNYYGVPPNDRLIPMSLVCPKAAEGGLWMNSVEGFEALRANYEAQDIGVLPWMIPRGRSMPGAYEEGEAAWQTLQILGGGYQQIDLEYDPSPSSYYWVGGEAEVDEFGRGAQDAGATGAPFVLLPDSRHDKLIPEHFWYWYGRPWVQDRVHPQAYSSIFYPGPYFAGRQKRGIDDATKPLLAGGIAPANLYPVLSTTDNDGLNPIGGDELQEGILYCHQQGFSGFLIWRRGFYTPEQRDAMHALDDPWYVPGPDPDPTPWQTALARLNATSIAQRVATEEVIRLAPAK